MKKRILWIDSLKGFATICVVLGHIANGYLGAEMFIEHTALLRDLFNGIYLFHMALFFTVSGMTYRIAYFQSTSETTSFKEEKYRAQVINLILIYLFYSVVLGLSKAALSRFVNDPVSVCDVLLIWGKPIAVHWYVYVLVIYYVFFKNCITKGLCRNHCALSLSLLFVSLISGFCNTNGWFEVQRCMFHALFFYSGVRLAENTDRLQWPLTVGFLGVSAFLSVRYWSNESYITGIPIVNTVVAIGFVSFFILMFSHVHFFNQINALSYLGKHSLEIYLLHNYFITASRAIFPRLGINNFCTCIELNTVLGIGIPIILSEASKKIGIYELFFSPAKILTRIGKGRDGKAGGTA